ncbi:hypothetical protein GCM10025738_27260 [Microbacterium fluvii]
MAGQFRAPREERSDETKRGAVPFRAPREERSDETKRGAVPFRALSEERSDETKRGQGSRNAGAACAVGSSARSASTAPTPGANLNP